MLLSIVAGMLIAIPLLIFVFGIRYMIRKHREDVFFSRLERTIKESVKQGIIEAYNTLNKQNKND